MPLGDKIKMHRKALGLTQTELGQKLGVKVNAVSKWECGRVEAIPTSKIKALAEIFDVKPSYLIDDAQTEKPTVGEDDGLSERERQLIQLVRRLSDKQVDGLLDLLRSQQPQEK